MADSAATGDSDAAHEDHAAYMTMLTECDPSQHYMLSWSPSTRGKLAWLSIKIDARRLGWNMYPAVVKVTRRDAKSVEATRAMWSTISSDIFQYAKHFGEGLGFGLSVHVLTCALLNGPALLPNTPATLGDFDPDPPRLTVPSMAHLDLRHVFQFGEQDEEEQHQDLEDHGTQYTWYVQEWTKDVSGHLLSAHPP
jgi:hypothetical protein